MDSERIDTEPMLVYLLVVISHLGLCFALHSNKQYSIYLHIVDSVPSTFTDQWTGSYQGQHSRLTPRKALWFFRSQLCALFLINKIDISVAIQTTWLRWRWLPSYNLKGKMMTKTCMTRRQIRTAISKMPPTQAMWRETLKLVAQLRAEIVVLKKSNSWVWPAVLFGTPLKYC